MVFSFFFFYLYGVPRDLHCLTHSFPTRRSSDLAEVVERWQRMCLSVGHLLQLGLHLPDKAVAHLAQPLVGSQLGPVRLRHLEDRGHAEGAALEVQRGDRKSTRLNSSH